MKSVFLSIVVLTCSGCVVADLEFYPESKRSEPDVSEEEWIKEPQPKSNLQRYLQEAATRYRQDRERTSYPSWPKHLFNNKDLALRLLNKNEKHYEPSRKLYFKILPSGRDTKAQLNRLIQSKDAGALLSLFKPIERGTLDDDSDGFDADFDDETDELDKPDEEEVHYHRIDSDDSAHTDDERSSGQMYDVDSVYTPEEFAMAPSDPGYFNSEQKLDEEKPNFHVQLDDDDMGGDVGNFVYNQPGNSRDPEERNEEASDVVAQKSSPIDETAGVYIIAVVAGISAAATVGLIAFGIGWYNLQKHVKNASDVDYPAYGITGPNKDISPSGDRRLAQSAQMYHYQHQKQQIIAMERAAASERHGSVSEVESDEENEEGDYTVYECPGLAPTCEMEVKNPLFQDDPTPAQTPALKTSENGGAAPKK